ncbi:3-phosphoinositide-dependent protein kinase B-like [Adelges cooleyi]|uniref:3-phosphoinositide-dependent protein kinase B-like n=1 Tax=Adelges cooleyi TaxID=133065 RepID=UPI0021803C26|nr:3-phosphoinositide-dependent protein kinase B-like [Adelges cooleyi]XP_050437679.1 3-phosphoinositide-dependent protein kinase B-like [Adelges cooleyi]XP_050437681.1 3-phosphoinositide-dependent protein kinase B-like [Adelges cooleyi]XP_050437682.1 3-phosphoinositide-dependent protein kinase B-like [Adelges cooleyi]
MTNSNNSKMLIDEENNGNVSAKLGRIQDKHVWKSLRTHILSRREKNKKAEAEAEVLRKKKCVEFQQMEENKLSLAQINGRLTALKDRRDELEEEKRALLNQVQTADDAMAASLVVPKSEFNCEPLNNKLVLTNNISTVVSHHRSTTLLQQHQHIIRQQTTITAESGVGSPSGSNSLNSVQQPLMLHNSNAGGANNQTLLVCSPAAINAVAANNQNNSATRSPMGLSASLSSTMTMSFTKVSSLYSSTTHLLAPNVGSNNKLGRTPSPQPPAIQQQTYQQQQQQQHQQQQQQIVVPFPTYKQMNNSSGGNSIMNSMSTPNVVNNINPSIAAASNNSYSMENLNRRGSRDETPSSFNRNVLMWNNSNNNPNKNNQPNVSMYGSFYQPSPGAAVNYCVNNGIPSSPSSSSSSVNTVYSYSGPPPPLSRTDSSGMGNLMVSASAGEHGGQLSKSISSHQQQQQQHHHQPHHLAHSNPPMYMSPGIRNQTSNHAYHPKPPPHNLADIKMIPPTSGYYQQQPGRNMHPSSAGISPQSPHQMQSQKSHNVYMRQPSASSASQLSPVMLQSSQHGSYSTSTNSGYSNKSPGPAISSADMARYQHQSQPPSSRDMNN